MGKILLMKHKKTSFYVNTKWLSANLKAAVKSFPLRYIAALTSSLANILQNPQIQVYFYKK
jgi:hypothetical protein